MNATALQRDRSRPFGPGSVSLGLHPMSDLGVAQQVEVLLAQARLAEQVGFDGVTLSEHHAGFPSYLPQPLVVCGWILEATSSVWVAPAPLLLGLRNPLLVAEEIAWMAVRHPRRVSLALAPGYAASDFDALGVEFDSRIEQFRTKLRQLVGALSGTGSLGSDPAIEAWSANPSVLLSATNSTAAAQLAAELAMGIVFPGGEDADRLGALATSYRRSAGKGPVVWIRNAWLGEPPRTAASAKLAEAYRQSAASGMRQAQGFNDHTLSGSPAEVASRAADLTRRAGADAFNVRLHVAGASPAAAGEQIERFGAEVLPALRAAAMIPAAAMPRRTRLR